MKRFLKKIRQAMPFLAKDSIPQISAEELTAEFRLRYHNFKLLLAANNKALDLMADLESASLGDKTFGMAFLRATCTACGVNVFQMITNMEELAPGKYQALFERHKAIQEKINLILAKSDIEKKGELVLDLEKVDSSFKDQVGNKMANLGEVKNKVKLEVPFGFCITAAAYNRFLEYNDLEKEIYRLTQSAVLDRMDKLFTLSSKIQQKIVKAEVPPQLAQEVENAYQRLAQKAGHKVTVSLRSSALGEDSAKASFAGQYASHLNVNHQHILDTYKEVAASKYTPQAMHYRFVRGIKDTDVAMCVGCLAMVDAVSGGVCYTANPLDKNDRNIQVNSTWGLPRSVVDGRSQADIFVLDRKKPYEILSRKIAPQKTAYVCYPEEGVCKVDSTGSAQGEPSLNDEQLKKLTDLSLALEEHYGLAQDVEWALDQNDRLIILQCRPLKQTEQQDEQTEEQIITDEKPLIKKGLKVSPGAAYGPVFWVRKDSDALLFPHNAILVVEHPSPRWAALLGRAKAVISKTGGPAGHLATVAREYGLPGIFNLQQDAEKLENEQMITVYADTTTIYPGKLKQVVKQAKPPKNLMSHSPVYQTLQKAMRHITPLTLLDPDSNDFKAANCQTFHDLTRFCHEKSVQEMFNFGKDQNFYQQASKQLHYNVPMQWWIINLDDGFLNPIKGKYVKLDNINCKPMMALWDGMIAIPWEGPPAVSGKGFASVLFQATTNPALATPFKTSFSNKNYFMISKYFMNLQSRFGFHFATVEAMVSPRQQENYLSFSFKGGAADIKRRQARVFFINEFLDEWNFRVSIKEDTVTARVEQLPEHDMQQRLKVVGYLLMHTRQLDMIMSNKAVVAKYREKMANDIKKIINQEELSPKSNKQNSQ